MCPQQWYEAWPARLGLEAMAVRERFPGFRFQRAPDGTLLLWGQLRSVSGAMYQIALVYPRHFPHTSPRVYPIPRLSGPHQYADGAMCLFRADDRFWVSTSTAATILAAAALWLNAHEHWRKYGRWLGREHS